MHNSLICLVFTGFVSDTEKGDAAGAADALKELKKELENQKKQFEDELQKNKEQLQLVEMQLTQKDTSEKTEALLTEKQNLLHAQWSLDEKKRNCERQILKIEQSLEHIKHDIHKGE